MFPGEWMVSRSNESKDLIVSKQVTTRASSLVIVGVEFEHRRHVQKVFDVMTWLETRSRKTVFCMTNI